MITKKILKEVKKDKKGISIENFMLGTRVVYNTVKKVCAPN